MKNEIEKAIKGVKISKLPPITQTEIQIAARLLTVILATRLVSKANKLVTRIENLDPNNEIIKFLK